MIRNWAYGERTMKPTRGTNSLPQMTAAEFAAAMKHHGFGVCVEPASSIRPANVQASPGRPCAEGEGRWTGTRRWRRSFVNATLRSRGARSPVSRHRRRVTRVATGSPAGPSSPRQHAGTRDARHALCKGNWPSRPHREGRQNRSSNSIPCHPSNRPDSANCLARRRTCSLSSR
jgi:hypothetical protein